MASPVAKHMEDWPSPPDEEFIKAPGFYTTTCHTSRGCEIEVEIEEEEEEEEEEHSRDLFEIKNYTRMSPIKEDYESSQFSFETGPNGENHVIYVVVTKLNKEISMDALVWTLKNVIDRALYSNDPTSNTVVYLIHVFPELRYIATPLGKLPISQANPEQKETFMIQERIKRRDFLGNFLHLCSASKVRVETILIESDMEGKAILDLIPILNIRKLVLGTSKSTLRKMRSKRGSGTVEQILKNAPEFCDVKIICEGKEVREEEFKIESPTTPSPRANVTSPKFGQVQDQINDTFACCFKPKAES